jgi:hypothetical protein
VPRPNTAPNKPRQATAKSWRDVLPIHPAAEMFPLMSPDELRVLGEDIKANGLKNPVTLWAAEPDSEWFLLDGRNRLDAMELIGLSTLEDHQWQVIFGSKGGDPYAFVVSANIHRRHLTAEQKRDLVAKLLKARPEQSDRQIAEQTKSNRTTVGQIRKNLEATGDVSIIDTRTDTRGRQQPAHKPPSPARSPEEIEAARTAMLVGSPDAPQHKPPTLKDVERIHAKLVADGMATTPPVPDAGNDIPPEESAERRKAHRSVVTKAMQSSGARAAWFSVVARKIMDGGQIPPSIDSLCLTVPGEITTAFNDGSVTAAKVYGEDRRNDFRAGQQFFIREVLDILRAQGLVGGDDSGFTWLEPLDGTWQVDVDGTAYNVFGQKERRLSADRNMLGERGEDGIINIPVGMFMRGTAQPLEVQIIGAHGRVLKEVRKFQVHPLALMIPPMTERERESLRESIARDGVHVPIVIYQEKILDGRHRVYFAVMLKKPIRIEEFKGTEEEAKRLVATLNLNRRHLTLTSAPALADMSEPAP